MSFTMFDSNQLGNALKVPANVFPTSKRELQAKLGYYHNFAHKNTDMVHWFACFTPRYIRLDLEGGYGGIKY